MIYFFSDKNQLCCTNCQFSDTLSMCHTDSVSDTSCEGVAFCTGNSGDCPHPQPKANGTACLEKGECRDGTCVPFCETHSMVSCICDTGKKDSQCLDNLLNTANTTFIQNSKSFEEMFSWHCMHGNV